MGSVYQRGTIWWYKTANPNYPHKSRKRYVQLSSGSTKREDAEALLAKVERALALQKRAGLTTGTLTVAKYAAIWLKQLEATHPLSVRSQRSHVKHIVRHIGPLPIDDVKRDDIKQMVKELQATRVKKKMKGQGSVEKLMAVRTVRVIYDTASWMFGDALSQNLIPVTPCTLKTKKGELPEPADDSPNPMWRDESVFTRGEVEVLISHPDLSLMDRVIHGIFFLTGARRSELPPIRFRHYDPTVEPLGRLFIPARFHQETHQEIAGTKATDNRARKVPVHPTLAKLLAEWRLHGFEAVHGRKPTPDDLMLPEPKTGMGRPRKGEGERYMLPSRIYERIQANLERLCLRHRRVHDARRTFVSIAQDDGARPEILKHITHPPRKGVFELYTTISWPTLCAEVSLIKVHVRDAAVSRLPAKSLATVGYKGR